ncbi:hypothetical protein [Crassaminicella profunda]|uniref:hypothetical protein n=1 Tax=Crassaminicella profunda TaxID=1286698 RepID=UPI001CA74F1D|nr:hypothetical protein [Crassaminicella profunda]QZY56654.1 hypothetical protein K7H06_06965 [Crassaminicella profunda]
MPKYGRGLNREIVGAVNIGMILEPFSINEVREFVEKRKWGVTDNYLNVCLANGSSLEHSLTYKKYFVSLGDGKYRLVQDYKGDKWK